MLNRLQRRVLNVSARVVSGSRSLSRQFCTPSFVGSMFQSESSTSSVFASLPMPAEPKPLGIWETTAHQFPASHFCRFVSVCTLSASINSSWCRATGSAPTAVGRSLLLTWCPGTRCRTTYETPNSARTLSDNMWTEDVFIFIVLLHSGR